MEYRFSHLGTDCRVLRQHEFQAETDVAALDVAWEVFKLTGWPQHGFELWQGTRHVFTHNRAETIAEKTVREQGRA